jgi:hypothetical protein
MTVTVLRWSGTAGSGIAGDVTVAHWRSHANPATPHCSRLKPGNRCRAHLHHGHGTARKARHPHQTRTFPTTSPRGPEPTGHDLDALLTLTRAGAALRAGPSVPGGPGGFGRPAADTPAARRAPPCGEPHGTGNGPGPLWWVAAPLPEGRCDGASEGSVGRSNQAKVSLSRVQEPHALRGSGTTRPPVGDAVQCLSSPERGQDG